MVPCTLFCSTEQIEALLRPLRFLSTRMDRSPWTRVPYYYLCCWNTFCMIATINIFFRCPDWPTAKSYVSAIFLSGVQPYIDALLNLGDFPPELIDGAIWTLVVFAAHESQRYLQTQEWILASWTRWAIVCFVAFWTVITFGIEGPQFIYYQF